MTNTIENLGNADLAEIIYNVFNVKGNVDFEDLNYGFRQVHFNVTSLSAIKVRKVNKIVYERTGLFPEWETMIDSIHTLDNPTILVHLSIMEE